MHPEYWTNVCSHTRFLVTNIAVAQFDKLLLLQLIEDVNTILHEHVHILYSDGILFYNQLRPEVSL